MKSKEVDLSICIVNWNSGSLLSDCVRSIVAHTGQISYEILIVDNNSSDDSLSSIRDLNSERANIHVIENHSNIGFASANNIAIKRASGRYIVLLNPDTLLTENAFDQAVEFLDSHPDCGAIGPKLLNMDDSLQPSVSQFPTVSGMFWEMTKLRLIFPNVRIFSSFKRHDIDYDLLQEVDQPSGACLFVRHSVIKQVGLLDSRFFMYYEEVDWCFRIKTANWIIYYVPSIEVVHLGGQSSIKNIDVRIIQNSRSKLSYFQKHYSDDYFKLLFLRTIIIIESMLKIGWISLNWPRYKSDNQSFSLSSILTRYFFVILMALGFKSVWSLETHP